MSTDTFNYLRTVCDANTPIAHDEHKHQCPNCGTIWFHNDAMQSETRENFETAHHCPKCDTRQTHKFRGSHPISTYREPDIADVRLAYALLSGRSVSDIYERLAQCLMRGDI